MERPTQYLAIQWLQLTAYDTAYDLVVAHALWRSIAVGRLALCLVRVDGAKDDKQVRLYHPEKSMYGQNKNDDNDGIIILLKELTDGLGRLVSDHIKLARLELIADAKILGRRAAVLAVIVPLVFIGYGSICIGLAVVLSRWMGLGVALVLVGAVHFLGAAIALGVTLRQVRRQGWMRETAHEVNQSVTQIAMSTIHGSTPDVVASECAIPDARASTVNNEEGSHVAEPRQ